MQSEGYCECGCGRPAPIAPCTNRHKGWIKGRPLRFCKGHQTRRRNVTSDYLAEDRGYETPCWIWQLTKSKGKATGYGLAKVKGITRQAHRVYYERYVGPIPDGLVIDHLCRVRDCVNPSHLEPVTQAENARRGVRDSPNWGRTTSARTFQILDAAQAHDSTYTEIARRFGVDPSYVSRIARGKCGPLKRREVV